MWRCRFPTHGTASWKECLINSSKKRAERSPKNWSHIFFLFLFYLEETKCMNNCRKESSLTYDNRHIWLLSVMWQNISDKPRPLHDESSDWEVTQSGGNAQSVTLRAHFRWYPRRHPRHRLQQLYHNLI